MVHLYKAGVMPTHQLIIYARCHNILTKLGLTKVKLLSLIFQVGLTEKGSVFVILGSGRIQPVTFTEFTPKELKKCKVQCCYNFVSCDETIFAVTFVNSYIVEIFICGFGEKRPCWVEP